MPPQYGPYVLAAFSSASGIPVAVVLDAIRLALGGLALIWLVWAVAKVAQRALHDQLGYRKAGGYMLRAAVLTLLVLFVLW